MAQEVMAIVKLHCPAGQATPAPPIGPALGAHGANIAEFVKQFNDRTRDQMGMTIPVEISIYKDRSFDFICVCRGETRHGPPRLIHAADMTEETQKGGAYGRVIVLLVGEDLILDGLARSLDGAS